MNHPPQNCASSDGGGWDFSVELRLHQNPNTGAGETFGSFSCYGALRLGSASRKHGTPGPSQNHGRKWKMGVSPIWVSLSFMGSFPLNHDCGRKSSHWYHWWLDPDIDDIHWHSDGTKMLEISKIKTLFWISSFVCIPLSFTCPFCMIHTHLIKHQGFLLTWLWMTSSWHHLADIIWHPHATRLVHIAPFPAQRPIARGYGLLNSECLPGLVKSWMNSRCWIQGFEVVGEKLKKTENMQGSICMMMITVVWLLWNQTHQNNNNNQDHHHHHHHHHSATSMGQKSDLIFVTTNPPVTP